MLYFLAVTGGNNNPTYFIGCDDALKHSKARQTFRRSLESTEILCHYPDRAVFTDYVFIRILAAGPIKHRLGQDELYINRHKQN